jgi:hypothetical protein
LTLCFQHCAKACHAGRPASQTEESSWNLTGCTGRHSGGKGLNVLFDLSNGGSLAMIRNCCALWLAFLSFICTSSYFSISHLFLRKECCSVEEVTTTDV